MPAPADYTGYFDESGKSGDSKVVAIAGYISTPLKWSRFTKEWTAVLKEFGVSNFHATDCESGQGEFKGIDKATRTVLVSKLAPIINNHIVFGVSAAFFVDEYNELTAGKSTPTHPYIQDPYYACFFTCIYKVLIEQMKLRTNSYERIELVFHQNNEMQGRAEMYFKSHQEIKLDQGRFTQLTFGDDKKLIPLQTADLLAYETRKGMHNYKYDPKRPLRTCLDVLMSTKKLKGAFYAKDELTKIINVIRESGAF